MTNSTEVYWDVDGTSLQTYCMNVESLSPKWTTPTHRGDDVVIAFQHGALHQRKHLEARTISLGMWVNGFGSTGAPTALGLERQFNANMKALQALFFREFADQITLTKRWKDPATGAVVSASAKATLVSAFEPEMQGPHAARVSVELRLTDPFFYAPEVLQELTTAGSTFSVAGDVSTSKIRLVYNGALVNPEIVNSSLVPALSLRVGLGIANGDTVTLEVADFSAARASDSANVVGSVTRSGSRSWLRLRPGSNTLSLTVSGGSGTVSIFYRPAYL